MIKYFYSLLTISFFLISCSTTSTIVGEDKLDLTSIYFDVVTKDLKFEGEFPNIVVLTTKKWFDSKVKINGLDGDMTLFLKNYRENISFVDNGKRVDVSFDFELIIKKNSLSSKKTIAGNVKSYSSLKGTFSISDFEKLIKNTQIDLVELFSKDLRSKI